MRRMMAGGCVLITLFTKDCWHRMMYHDGLKACKYILSMRIRFQLKYALLMEDAFIPHFRPLPP